MTTEPNSHRFHLYFVDSGFHPHLSPIMHRAIHLCEMFAKGADVYVLDEENSTAFLRQFPLLIGKDPVLVVIDQVARKESPENGFGLHFQFGTLSSEKRMMLFVKILLRALNDPVARQDLTGTIREAIHMDGLRGSYQILMETLGMELRH